MWMACTIRVLLGGSEPPLIRVEVRAGRWKMSNRGSRDLRDLPTRARAEQPRAFKAVEAAALTSKPPAFCRLQTQTCHKAGGFATLLRKVGIRSAVMAGNKGITPIGKAAWMLGPLPADNPRVAEMSFFGCALSCTITPSPSSDLYTRMTLREAVHMRFSLATQSRQFLTSSSHHILKRLSGQPIRCSRRSYMQGKDACSSHCGIKYSN